MVAHGGGHIAQPDRHGMRHAGMPGARRLDHDQRIVHRIEALPLTGSGKLDVKTLRQRAAELAATAPAPGATEKIES